MPRAARIPEPHELLCESCGYTLSGLDETGHCPECGRPIADSLPGHRRLTAWEAGQGVSTLPALLRTAGSVLIRPSRFFRSLAVDPAALVKNTAYRASLFGLIYRLAAAALIATAVTAHTMTVRGWLGSFPWDWVARYWLLWLAVGYVATAGMTYLVAKLTAWEAAYRGLRLPYRVVSRALDYHTVHLLVPTLVIALLAVAYAAVYAHDLVYALYYVEPYLYTLAGLVVIGSLYLFRTYWSAMRNLMYAN